jgi:hypothetical protein
MPPSKIEMTKVRPLDTHIKQIGATTVPFIIA